MMNDLINRQDAINLLKKWSDGYAYIETETELAIKEFQRLPSAQPEPVRRGFWVPDSLLTDTILCSNCGFNLPTEEMKSNYCPNCGAKMENDNE